MNTILLEDLAQQIQEQHDAAQTAANHAVQHAFEAGKLLLRAKQQVRHGEWSAWLKNHCRLSERTVQSYLRIAREWPKLTAANPQRVADLPLRQLLKELSNSSKKCGTSSELTIHRDAASWQALSCWYDQQMVHCLLLRALGWDSDQIHQETGFDRHEVERILTPQKPIRFQIPSECALLQNIHVSDFADRYHQRVDTLIAEIFVKICKAAHTHHADRENLPQVKPILATWEAVWRSFIHAGLSWQWCEQIDHAIGWECCAMADARLAIGLDREAFERNLPLDAMLLIYQKEAGNSLLQQEK